MTGVSETHVAAKYGSRGAGPSEHAQRPGFLTEMALQYNNGAGEGNRTLV